MKVSRLIAELVAYLAEHGDTQVGLVDTNNPGEFGELEDFAGLSPEVDPGYYKPYLLLPYMGTEDISGFAEEIPQTTVEEEEDVEEVDVVELEE